METKDPFISNIVDSFNTLTSKPETFISSQEKFAYDVRQLLKNTYDFAKKEEIKPHKSNALPELIVQNFDLEQIWQQIELQNDQLLQKSITNVTRLAVAKDRLLFQDIHEDQSSGDDSSSDSDENLPSNELPLQNNTVGNEEDEQLELEDDSNEENLDGFSDENDEDGSNHDDNVQPTKKFKPSVLDDEFFKLDEMNNFLTTVEKEFNKNKKDKTTESESEEESIDMFEADSENEEDNNFEGNDKEKNPRYKDFFREQNQEWEEGQDGNIENGDGELDEDDENDKGDIEEENGNDIRNYNDSSIQKSTLELREERLKMKIQEIENAAVSEKPWQLKGEITAENRPQNSLLQEVLEFDLTSRPAPVITEETTHILEDVIRQRIKDKVFDDVERKEKPVETPLEFKKKLMLDQEKSKESLAQIYEKEYLQQREALNPDTAEKEEEEPKLHQEIKTLMHSLFSKLDALSNFHFTPKPAAPELKVVSNLPAINMEEVAPVAATDATLLAPEEIKAKTKGDDIGKSERTDTDKKRERRKKRQKQREHAKEKKRKESAISKMKPGLGNKYSKEKAKKLLERVTKEANVDKMDESRNTKSVKSSTAFFTELEEEVRSQIKNKVKSNSKNSKKLVNAKKIKL